MRSHTVYELIAEWRQGCNCAEFIDRPEDCPDCTLKLIRELEKRSAELEEANRELDNENRQLLRDVTGLTRQLLDNHRAIAAPQSQEDHHD